MVTGSSRGLGLSIARAYAREGAAVVLSSRSQAESEQAAAGVAGPGVKSAGFACDVADLEQVEALAEAAVHAFGRLDIWVNNAGKAGPYGPTASIPEELFKSVISTNIIGTYHGSIAALRYFIPQGSGKLINILGRGDDQPVPFQNAYASSKSWIRAFTVAMAKEYKNSGVGIFAYNPGLMRTEFMSRVEAVEGYSNRLKPLETVMRLWSNPPDLPAEKAVWLASSATDGKTGLVIRTISPVSLLGGVLREGARRLTGRSGPEYHLEVSEVPSALQEPVRKAVP